MSKAVQHGFRRYVVAVQYHGSSFLGFTQQLDQENRILADGTDLRGYFTVESRLRAALTRLLSSSSSSSTISSSLYDVDTLQVSSRTDRGVHAFKNTFHVDLHTSIPFLQRPDDSIRRGWNFYLRRPPLPRDEIDQIKGSGVDDVDDEGPSSATSIQKRVRNATQYMRGGEWTRTNPSCDVRILAVQEAPLQMANPSGHLYNQAPYVDWNARFSAISRTYVYRILHAVSDHDRAAPFEWDRAWRITDTTNVPLNVTAMRKAAAHLLGRHDFTSFRAARCQRATPVMTLYDIQIHAEPYEPSFFGMNVRHFEAAGDTTSQPCQLVTILYRGDSFVYRQVRNMTGCLVQVGRGKLAPDAVRDILEARTRRHAPATAPAHGLFLVNVLHEGVQI